jgi:multidrug transporter EmrE-like cation transporter
MEQTMAQALQRKGRQLRNAAIALVVIVAAQVVALEVVLRGWQGRNALAVFTGIGASALLCAVAVIIFRGTRKRDPREVDSQ